MKTTIVTTTINVPRALEKYAQNFKFFGHANVDFIVIGDKKTPPEARGCCAAISDRYYPCEYLGIEEQRSYLERFPALWNHIPFNCIQRRNVGLLKAWENRADVIITIDDDNLMLNQDFIRLHGIIGTAPILPAFETSSGWFNVCSLLEEASGTPFYHRGFPRGQRWKEKEVFTCVAPIRRRVAVNAGLWLDDPDIDAMTRLERPIVVRAMKGDSPTVALHPGTWSPFNSQNTAMLRDLIPAYFQSPFVGRYDDIWPSYIATRIIQHMGDVVAFGQPLLRQKRNEHNLWKDMDNERIGSILTDEFCDVLRSIDLTGSTYHECYGELAAKLASAWQPAASWSDPMIKAREKLLEGMSIWHSVFCELMNKTGIAEDDVITQLASLQMS